MSREDSLHSRSMRVVPCVVVRRESPGCLFVHIDTCSRQHVFDILDGILKGNQITK